MKDTFVLVIVVVVVEQGNLISPELEISLFQPSGSDRFNSQSQGRIPLRSSTQLGQDEWGHRSNGCFCSSQRNGVKEPTKDCGWAGLVKYFFIKSLFRMLTGERIWRCWSVPLLPTCSVWSGTVSQVWYTSPGSDARLRCLGSQRPQSPQRGLGLVTWSLRCPWSERDRLGPNPVSSPAARL